MYTLGVYRVLNLEKLHVGDLQILYTSLHVTPVYTVKNFVLINPRSL